MSHFGHDYYSLASLCLTCADGREYTVHKARAHDIEGAAIKEMLTMIDRSADLVCGSWGNGFVPVIIAFTYYVARQLIKYLYILIQGFAGLD